MLQLYILKLIKSQVPYCGRKWRQCELDRYRGELLLLTRFAANMKVITSIYMSIRPDLRDEWLTGTEPDDGQDRQVSLMPYCMKWRAGQCL